MVFIDTIKIIGVLCLALTILGTVGNLLIFLVCYIRLRAQITFVFIMFLAITDTITLYGWNISHFGEAFFHENLQETIPTCRLLNYFQYASFHASAWLLVSASSFTLIQKKFTNIFIFSLILYLGFDGL